METISECLAAGRFISVQLVNTYFVRIEQASHFKAVPQVNPNALTAAQDLDDERK